MNIVYVTPKGEAVPCNAGKKWILPVVKGGYKLLKSYGFPIAKRRKKK